MNTRMTLAIILMVITVAIVLLTGVINHISFLTILIRVILFGLFMGGFGFFIGFVVDNMQSGLSDSSNIGKNVDFKDEEEDDLDVFNGKTTQEKGAVKESKSAPQSIDPEKAANAIRELLSKDTE